MSEPKNPWDKADVIGKLLIPVLIAGATYYLTYSTHKRDEEDKRFATTIDILQAPTTSQPRAIREWAAAEFSKVTHVPLSVAETFIERPLPGASASQLPKAGALRVSIFYPRDSSPKNAEKINLVLSAANYSNITFRAYQLPDFPKQTEVRFYYKEDEEKARALNEYVNKELKIQARLVSRFERANLPDHNPGDIHIYVKE